MSRFFEQFRAALELVGMMFYDMWDILAHDFLGFLGFTFGVLTISFIIMMIIASICMLIEKGGKEWLN